MNRARMLMAVAGLGAVLLPLSAQRTAPHDSPGRKVKPPATAEPLRGERVFKQNCGRCHNPPQSFPPQISGSILRHMRVRAALSASDEKALLRFMNP
jgi:mono/diheme cytochrome c family protein